MSGPMSMLTRLPSSWPSRASRDGLGDLRMNVAGAPSVAVSTRTSIFSWSTRVARPGRPACTRRRVRGRRHLPGAGGQTLGVRPACFGRRTFTGKLSVSSAACRSWRPSGGPTHADPCQDGPGSRSDRAISLRFPVGPPIAPGFAPPSHPSRRRRESLFSLPLVRRIGCQGRQFVGSCKNSAARASESI